MKLAVEETVFVIWKGLNGNVELEMITLVRFN
jgi:hypothetical protein